MKNKYFLWLNVILFTIISIILLPINKIWDNSFWIPYLFLIVSFVTNCFIVSYDIIKKEEKEIHNFAKYILCSAFIVLECILNVVYLVVKTNNLYWLLIPNILIVLVFIGLVLVFNNFGAFIKEQENEEISSNKFKTRISILVEDLYMKETDNQIKQELFNLSNIAKSIIPSNDKTLIDIENAIEQICLNFQNFDGETKHTNIIELKSLFAKRDNFIKELRTNE